jgi:purine-binding chemotaxis protein CheW
MSDHFDETRSNKMAEGGDTQQFLTFTVADSEYGVDIMTVREIKGWTETTRLPNTPDYMRGVMNLRGLIIPIFDLRARFSDTLTHANASNVVIILAVGERNIGILVDTVSDILTVNSGDIKQAPKTEGDPANLYIDGLILLEQRMVVVLDVSKLFGSELLTHSPAPAAA